MTLILLFFLSAVVGMSYAQEEEVNPVIKLNRASLAHGVIMGLVFVILFPLGAMSRRLPGVKGLLWVHVGAQLFAYTMAVAGMGLGIWLAINLYELKSFTHPQLGISIVVLLFFQPFLGTIHHRIFVKQHRSSIWAHIHVWYGRVLMMLGVINGGLGLQLAVTTENQLPATIMKGKIAYGVLAGIMFVLYVGVVLMAHFRRPKAGTGDVPLNGNTSKPV